jgi:hydrogenase maturation protease
MAKIVVIGFGNPLRSDDSFGWKATEELQAIVTEKDVEFIECQQLAPEFAEKISKASLAIFIDADSNGVAGAVHCYPIYPKSCEADSITHHLDPCTLVTLAEKLYGRAPEALVVSVTGECFGFGKTLSEPVASSLPGVVRHLADVIHEKSLHPTRELVPA